MTSALLNMLETPEETSAEVYSEDGTYHYAVDEDDASRLIGGLSLVSQAPTEIVSNLHGRYDASQWTPPGWHERDETQDMIHPFMQAESSAPQDSVPFQQPRAPPTTEHHSDFGQYLP